MKSTTFIKRPPNITYKEQCLLYTKEILCGRLFLGCYKDRRYVSVLDQYRDVIAISEEEIDLLRDLDKVRKKWINVTGVKWVGITGPDSTVTPKEYYFWVKLPNLPFDHYWFQIKQVKMMEDEIILHLKCIRKCVPPNPTITQTVLAKKTTSGNLTSISSAQKKSDVSKSVRKILLEVCNQAIINIQPCMTWKHLVEMFKLTFLILVVVVFEMIACIKFFGEYFLKLLRELSLLIQVISPIVTQVIDLLTKIIGGFFILFATIFGRNGNNFFLESNKNNEQKSVMYIPNESKMHAPAQNCWKKRNKMLREELLSSMNH